MQPMDQRLRSESIHKIFAGNLRRQCSHFESIAEFCRQSGINRQQFNRYLSGQNLPNPRSLKKICATLGTSEASLFVAGGLASASGFSLAEQAILGKMITALPETGLAALGDAATSLQDDPRSNGRIPSGVYLGYMPVGSLPGHLLRTVIKVSRVGGINVFTRRTSFRLQGSSLRNMTVGKHVGLILGDTYSSLFVGMNKMHPHEFTAQRFMHSITGNDSLRLGLSLVRSPVGEIACKIVLVRVGSGVAARRKALAIMGVVPQDDTSIPPEVLALLPNQPCDETIHDYLAVTEALQAHPKIPRKPTPNI
jgi:transcriptional regulator with XRE-family HTH domain